MRRFSVAAVSINTTPLDFENNLQRHISILQEQELEDTSIILFPELSISGYGCEDAFYRPWVWEKSMESLERILPFVGDRLVAVGLPLFHSPYLYNVIAILSHGRIQGFIPKKHLANTGVHYEKRWFSEWKNGSTLHSNVPFGNTIIQWNDLKIGVEVCEDSWVMNRPSHELSDLGADVILSPGASHFAFGKYETRSRIFQESSRAQENVFVFSNLVGNESGRIIFDGGNLITHSGNIIGMGKRLSLLDTEFTTAKIDLDDIRSARAKFFRSSGDDNRETSEKTLDRYSVIELTGTPFRENLQLSQKLRNIPEENIFQAFTSAVILGLFDYLRKSGTNGYTLSLSGGADSSAIAILVATMYSEITKARGKDYWSSRNYSKPILTTLYQKTKNNSEDTRIIAEKLSRELAVNYLEINIDEEVDLMVNRISMAIGRNLNWKEDDIALQNIQARARSPLVWLLANTEKHLLISTGNRSESSVGYTTMDGDSSGSIAPIAGVSKKFLLDWLHYISTEEDSRIPKLETLSLLLESRPSAELKPLSEAQEDEKDLMPYAILQRIEDLGINQGKRKNEILEDLSPKFDAYSEKQLSEMIDRFFHLFRISQWKRERLAIGFHLDDYGLDPKSSYRYPILSGHVV
ncbi:MAG: NAD(+) synthase [Leptospira sp.]|nr:NAD(+) synthase [Leptospira sp.]